MQDEQNPLVKRLEESTKPLTKSALIGKSKKNEKSLNQLLATGAIVNLSLTKGGYALVSSKDAKGRFAPEQITRAGILAYLQNSVRPLSLAEKGLKETKLPLYAHTKSRSVINELVREGLLIKLRVGSSNVVISTRAILQDLKDKPALKNIHLVSLDNLTTDRSEEIYAAYRAALAPGRTMVTLSELKSRLGWPLAELHDQIRRLDSAKRAHLIVGEPTVLSEDDLRAGIEKDRETKYYVELL